jgi:hypothetical protein
MRSFRILLMVAAILAAGAASLFIIDERITPESAQWLKRADTVNAAQTENPAVMATARRLAEFAALSRTHTDETLDDDVRILYASCRTFSSTCLRSIIANPDLVRRYLPQDPRYYRLHRDLMRELSREATAMTDDNIMWLLVAQRYSTLQPLHADGALDAELTLELLAFHRQLIGRAGTITIKTGLITALTAQVRASVLAMATIPDFANEPRLAALLAPLTATDFSINNPAQTAFAELAQTIRAGRTRNRYANYAQGTAINAVHHAYDQIAERSQLPTGRFWAANRLAASPRNPLLRSFITPIMQTANQYLAEHRTADTALAVARALRDDYRGSNPADDRPAPEGFAWRRDESIGHLCLGPDAARVNAGNRIQMLPTSVCMELIPPGDVSATHVSTYDAHAG